MKRSLTALAAGLLLCLSGCGQGADPPAQADPTPSVSTTTTSAPKGLSPEQTVRAWVRAYNRIAVSGDGSLAYAVQDPSCQTCDNLIRPLLATIKAGGAFRGGSWRVVRTHVKSHSRTKAVVYVLIAMAAGATRDRSGADFRSFAADRQIAEFHLENDDVGWRVHFVGWLS